MTRIDELLAAMTLEEKIGQLNMVAAAHAVIAADRSDLPEPVLLTTQ